MIIHPNFYDAKAQNRGAASKARAASEETAAAAFPSSQAMISGIPLASALGTRM